MNITIKNKDIKVDKSMSGRLIDKLAIATEQWEEDDLYVNNTEYECESLDYIIKEYDYDTDFISILNKDEKRALKIIKSISKIAVKKYNQSNLLAGAFLELNYEKRYNKELEKWIDMIKEEALSYYDSLILSKECQDLLKELEKGSEDFWKEMRNEWLNGDYRGDYRGLINYIKEYLECDDVEYDEKKDELFLDFSDDEVETISYNYYDDDKKMNAKEIKEIIISKVNDDQEYFTDKKLTENKKRVEERKELEKYQAEQRRTEKAERKAELLKMKKKKK